MRHPIRVGDYIRLRQSEMRDNAAAYPRLIRRPLTQRFRTVPRSLFVAWLGAAFAAASALNRVARWLGVHEDLAFYDALRTMRELAVVFSFYTAPRFVFDNARLLALAAELPEDERTRRYDWVHYVQRVHLPGLERYAVRGEPLPRAEEPLPAVGRCSELS